MSLLKIFKKEKDEKEPKKQAEKKVDIEKEKKPQATPVVSVEATKKIEKKKRIGASHGVIKPLVTEKSATLSSVNKYVFEVKPSMNKIEVKKAIQNMYGVKPMHIRAMNVSGKKVRYGRSSGKTKDWKKVIVSLKEGEKIEVYEGV